MSDPLDVNKVVPGGIKATDEAHMRTNDGTCSRCRKPVPDDEVPLMLWLANGYVLLIYCPACLGWDR